MIIWSCSAQFIPFLTFLSFVFTKNNLICDQIYVSVFYILTKLFHYLKINGACVNNRTMSLLFLPAKPRPINDMNRAAMYSINVAQAPSYCQREDYS